MQFKFNFCYTISKNYIYIFFSKKKDLGNSFIATGLPNKNLSSLNDAANLLFHAESAPGKSLGVKQNYHGNSSHRSRYVVISVHDEHSICSYPLVECQEK